MLRSLSPTLSPSPSGSPVLKATVMSVSYIFFLEISHVYMCRWMYLYVYLQSCFWTNGRILYISSFPLLFPFFFNISLLLGCAGS